MPYFVTPDNKQFRIDSAANMFLNGKCINIKADNPMSVAEASYIIDKDDLLYGVAVQVTGHVPVFEYGHTRDEDGKPVCVKVNTGHDKS